MVKFIKISTIIFFTLFIFLLFFSCSDSCDPCDPCDPEDQNNPPIIEEITMMPEPPISTDGYCQLVPIAIDKDGDELKYAWSATGGHFQNSLDDEIQVWIPHEPGLFTIRCTVNDGKATASMSVEILVN